MEHSIVELESQVAGREDVPETVSSTHVRSLTKLVRFALSSGTRRKFSPKTVTIKPEALPSAGKTEDMVRFTHVAPDLMDW